MDKKEDHIYIAIDLKSFYASVECQERNLNPLTTNLVVADRERTEKTICLVALLQYFTQLEEDFENLDQEERDFLKWSSV